MMNTPFIWGAGGEQLTPEQVAQKRQQAQAMREAGMDYSPVGHWTQGLARMAQGLVGGLEQRRANIADREGLDRYSDWSDRLRGAMSGTNVVAQALAQGMDTQPSAAVSDVARALADTRSGTIPSPAPSEVQADPGIANYFASARQAESGGNDLARNPNSSATGRYQFIDSTWRGLMEQYPQLGLTWDGRTDPAQQERAMQQFTSDNAAVLQRAGIPVDGGSLYAAHFLGAGGAVNALSQPDQTPMAAVVGEGVVKANPFLANMTVGDFRNWSAQKGGTASGGIPVSQSAQGGMNSEVAAILAEGMADPWVRHHGGPVLQALMGQQIQQQNAAYQQQLREADPLNQIKLEQARFDLEQDRMGLGGGSSRVQSSEILADGTVVAVMANGTPRVMSPSGEVLTGQAAADAIRAARDYGVENQRSIYGGRREGTLGADINLGGEAEAAKRLGTVSVDTGMGAWEEYGKVQSNIANIDEAISALDSGAKTGMVYNMLPNVSEASATLRNTMDRMGLDVIGSVTFGALSEGEMRLAMETAVPRNLGPEELRSWLVKKRDAQQKAADALADAAQYLTVPGNTINGWIEKNRAARNAGSASAPQQPAASDDDLLRKYGLQ